jgi:hypothetical protein
MAQRVLTTDIVTVTSTEDGHPVYRSLGFEDVLTIDLWTWTPPETA